MQFEVDLFRGNRLDPQEAMINAPPPNHTCTILAMQPTYCTSVASVDRSPFKCDQRQTATFDKALLTNEHRTARK